MSIKILSLTDSVRKNLLARRASLKMATAASSLQCKANWGKSASFWGDCAIKEATGGSEGCLLHVIPIMTGGQAIRSAAKAKDQKERR